MPYPNEHAGRVIEPSMFKQDSFRRRKITEGVDAIFGKLKGETKMSIQAYRFAKDIFTPAQAKAWLKEHKISIIKFEKAEEQKQNSAPIMKTLSKEEEMMKNNSHSIVANMSKLIEKKTMDGKEYFVCPAILINEGVHNGIFYPAEELAKFPEAWNGRPVPVYHPTLSGKPITANSPDVIEKQVVGQIFNARFEEGKLKADIWIDILKAKTNHPEILSKINQNVNMEVSTGLFTDDEVLNEERDWNGEKYSIIARNYRPDHLALLPDGVGSCSWADGAGMPRINEDMKDNELSYRGIESKLQTILSDRLDKSNEPWVEDVYEDKFIYSIYLPQDGKRRMFQQSYKTFETDKVELQGDAMEVERKIDYVMKENSQVLSARQPEGNKTNPQNSQEVNVERKELIDKLISTNIAEEADREHLSKLSELLFGKLEKVAEAPEKEATPAPVVVNEAKTVTEYVEKAPEAFKAELREGLRLNSEKRTNLIESIKANKANKFTEEELKDKSTGELEKLSELAKAVVGADFSAAASAPKANQKDDEVPEMPRIEFKK